jgi:hypothetical protein
MCLHFNSKTMVYGEFLSMPIILRHKKLSFLHKVKRFIGFRLKTDSKVHHDMLCCWRVYFIYHDNKPIVLGFPNLSAHSWSACTVTGYTFRVSAILSSQEKHKAKNTTIITRTNFRCISVQYCGIML